MTSPRQPYKIRGPLTWAAIREGYLAGASVPTLAKRYDVTTSAIHGRIKREGWGKYAHAAEEGAPPPALAPAYGAAKADWEAVTLHPRYVADEAMIATDRCLREGRLDEAAAYARVAEVLARIARADQEAERAAENRLSPLERMQRRLEPGGE
jgi:hypothetical protein